MSIHIGAKKGEIAETILLPGDPLRAKWIAETFFENPFCFNEPLLTISITETNEAAVVQEIALHL